MAIKFINPNVLTPEEERAKKVRELADASASTAEIASAQKQYDQAAALRDAEGPKGRRVGSRQTFVAAHPLEHAAHVWASKIRGDKADKLQDDLNLKMGKARGAAAEEEVRTRELEDSAELRAVDKNQRETDELAQNMIESNANIQRLTDQTANEEADNIRESAKADETVKKNVMSEKLSLYQEALKAGSGKNKQYKDFSDSTLSDIAEAGNVNNELAELKAEYVKHPEWSNPLGPFSVAAAQLSSTYGAQELFTMDDDTLGGILSGVGVPRESVDNFMGGLRWHARLKQVAELGPRNKLFGATFTIPEKNEWNAAGAINYNQPRDDVMARLDQMSGIYQNRANSWAKTAIAGRRDPSVFMAAGIIPWDEEAQARIASGGRSSPLMTWDSIQRTDIRNPEGPSPGGPAPQAMPEYMGGGQQQIIQGQTPEEEQRGGNRVIDYSRDVLGQR